MELFKNYKILIFPIFILLVLSHIYIDDELNPEAGKWIEHYSKPANIEKNAYISLLALSENNTEEVKKLYTVRLGQISKGTLDPSLILTYPYIDDFIDFIDDHNFYACDFEEEDCLQKARKNKPNWERKIQKFSSLTKQYREISTLTNFSPLNSIVTTSDFSHLQALQRLSQIEVYYNILDKKLDVAAKQLSQLMAIDRKFLRTATDAIFHVMPIVNFKSYYPPLLLELNRNGFSNWELFRDSLNPLTINDISMNKMWLSMYAYGTRMLLLESIHPNSIELDNFLYRLQAQIKYKENMTLNSLFEYKKMQLIPEHFQKINALEIVENVDKEAVAYSDTKLSEFENYTWFMIKNYRNIIGAIMEVTAMPKFINLYQDKFELDLNLLLINMMIENTGKPILELIAIEKYKNPYTGEKPQLNGSNVCYHLIDNPICLQVQI